MSHKISLLAQCDLRATFNIETENGQKKITDFTINEDDWQWEYDDDHDVETGDIRLRCSAEVGETEFLTLKITDAGKLEAYYVYSVCHGGMFEAPSEEIITEQTIEFTVVDLADGESAVYTADFTPENGDVHCSIVRHTAEHEEIVVSAFGIHHNVPQPIPHVTG